MKVYITKDKDGMTKVSVGQRPKRDVEYGLWTVSYKERTKDDTFDYINPNGRYFHSSILNLLFKDTIEQITWDDEPFEYELVVEKL